MIKKCTDILEQVRKTKPLIHHITNYVTVNDCANITLCIGASPVMADELEEASDIAGIASAVVLNTGTLNKATISSMIVAGQTANAKGIPVILDPVGVGASALRNKTVEDILKKIKISVLRGNISEIRFISGLQSNTKGVDASEDDLSNIADKNHIAMELAKKLNCVVAITGKIDVVSDGRTTVCLENGHSALGDITGTGCMCSSLIGSLCGADPSMPLEAAIAALLVMGISGEIAFAKAGEKGLGSFHTALFDAVSKIDGAMLCSQGKISSENH